ncbi:hypothetical protein FRC00_013818, partial [Tulasnella sp. 408]
MSRRFRPPKLIQTPKSEVEGSINDAVHSSLKALRRASKQAGSGVNTMDEDMRILERIFYKSNNSQRPTMAWKKLKHMRRLYWRLHECELVNFLDVVRLAFYPPGTTAVALNLVRTGFLPLGVSIMAIAARLQRVGKELIESIGLAASGLLPLLDKLKPGVSFKYQRALDGILKLSAGPSSGHRGFSSLPVETQDLGEAIARKPTEESKQPLQIMGEPISIVLLDDDREDELTQAQMTG